MKTRILSLLLSLGLLLPAFAGCTGEPESAPLSGSSGESGIPADDSDTAAEEGEWPIPAYAGFVMPEATDSLTLYASDFTDVAMLRAVDLFKERYPDVNVNECLFISSGIDTSVLAMNECECIRHFSAQTPVLFSVADENGGLSVQIGYFAAVPEASKNKLNAWRFVKILLSDAMQYGKEEAGKYPKTAFPTGNSVKKDAFERLTKLCKFWGGTEKEIGFVLDAAERITNAVMPTPVIRRYVITIMREYVTDPDGTNYDKQFEKLINTLELYKDE